MEQSEQVQKLLTAASSFYASGDYESAFENYRLAARRGSGDAAYHLGVFFEKGLYVKRDIKIAKQWYFTAATKGNKQAKERLDQGLPKDYHKEDDDPKSEDYVEPETHTTTSEQSPSIGEKPAVVLEELVTREDELTAKSDNPEELLKTTPSDYETRKLSTESKCTTDDKEDKELLVPVKEVLVQQESSNNQAEAESNEEQIETKQTLRWQALKEFLGGVAFIILGAVFTAMSSTKIYIGAYVYGGWCVLKSIYHLFKSFFSDGHEYVDLGLPSGTLWATTNIGATSPEYCGDFFAWGETTTKSDYSWSSLKYCEDNIGGRFSKYITQSKYGSIDSKTTLDCSDDAAYQNWGSDWCMPTQAQFQELKDKCVWTWNTHGYEVKGLNGNTIFLPASGSRIGKGECSGSGNYWSSTLYTDYPDRAKRLWFDSDNVDSVSYIGRAFGMQVRPVRCR